ncbi:acyl carrier protein [Ruminiclostridium josui]|nr:acyl carrier protein [Ruminiclostridium josui]
MDEDMLKKIIVDTVSSILDVAHEYIDAGVDWIEAGMDNVAMAKLTDKVNQTFGLEINVALLSEYRNIESLANYISEERKSTLQAYREGGLHS